MGVLIVLFNILFPITHSEPTHPISIVWGLIHHHQLLLWTSWFEKPHAGSLQGCNSPYRGWVHILLHIFLVISVFQGKCNNLTIIQWIWPAKLFTKSGWGCIYITPVVDKAHPISVGFLTYQWSHLALYKLTEKRNYFVPSINYHKVLELIFTLRAVKLSHIHSDICIYLFLLG